MSFFFGLLMFICVMPALLISYVLMYPKRWMEKKLIFGVKNRKEYKEGETAEEVGRIVEKYRFWGKCILIAGCVISGLLLFLQGMVMQTTVWTVFFMLVILLVNIPYILGNREMKALKRRMGLVSESGVSLVDLSNAGAVHALKPAAILVPNICATLLMVVSLLLDLDVISVGKKVTGDRFEMTMALSVFWFCNLLLLALAFVFDGLKNEVISTDSDVNANYNRAKKKNMADYFVLYSWVSFAYMVGMMVSYVFMPSELLDMISVIVFMILVMLAVVLFVARQKRIEARYEKEMTLLADDDDHWIAGIFYYNPKDKRLTVEKRVGVGGTVNVAHPVGKLLLAAVAFSLVVTFQSLIWMGQMESTPIRLMAQDGKLICHQLRDEYVIPYEEITGVEWGEDIHERKLTKISGVGMENLLKGNFSVDGESGCKVFLAPEGNAYLRVTTANGPTYYISGGTAEETRTVYDSLVNVF